jgi:hypothetical protein
MEVCSMRKSLLSLAAVAAAGAVAVPGSASAAGWNCSATALSGQPLGAPVAANVGAPTCRAASAGGNVPALPVPLQGAVVSARTELDGPAGDPARQHASATGEVASFGVGIPANLPIAVPTTGLNVPGVGNVDITSALRTLVPVPTGTLAGVQESSATASGQCASGSPRLSGASHTTGLTVLGQTLPTDQLLQQAINVVNATTIDPSSLQASALPAPLNTLPLGVLQPLLDAPPNIAVPATVAQVRLTPGSQTSQGGTLTQSGPRLVVSIAGQSVVDLTLGQASVSRGDVACGSVAVPQAQLSCTSRKLALIDVISRGSYTRLYGVADLKYVGKRVDVVSLWDGKVVARPIVQRDGSFQAKGALPPGSLRRGNRARYQARVGRERSLDLKLFRRMLVDEMSSGKGTVTIKGRVVRPLAEPSSTITIKRRVSCTKEVTVKTIKPDASGRFSATISAPTTGQAAVYRLQTSVRKHASSPKLFPTFTLPRAVELRR